MSSLTSILPAPRFAQSYEDPLTQNRYAHRSVKKAPAPPTIESVTGLVVKEPPPYEHRQGFVPRTIEDYGDGGAFPEIHVLQYPLDMGRKETVAQQKVTPLTVDEKGQIKYDMIARQLVRKDQQVYASYHDLVPKDPDEDALRKPTPEEALATAEKTRKALGLLVDASIAAAQPKAIKRPSQEEPVYIRYTPAQQGMAYNSGAQQRIIKLQEMPVDPLEPPKFRHKKLPAGPPSPPAPIMHSPPRKITVQDQQNWKIPPCVSNWKNIKGYVIPLDKRLAADGRGLHEVQINDKFAKLSEALFLSERTARKEIEARATMMRRWMRQQEEMKEEELRKLAMKARGASNNNNDESREEEAFEPKETEDDAEERANREELRKDRKRELRRELRMENMKDDKRGKSRGAREADRDVSEKIALGQAVPTSKDSMFDQRLFNQEQGLESGFGPDDEYNAFDKPLFRGGASSNYIYRPKPSEDMSESEVAALVEKSTARFKADKAFKGSEKAPSATQPRDKPVEFERDEADPFGLNVLLSDASTNNRNSKSSALNHIGQRGHLGAAVSGAREDYAGDAPKRNIAFQESSATSSEGREKRRKK